MAFGSRAKELILSCESGRLRKSEAIDLTPHVPFFSFVNLSRAARQNHPDGVGGPYQL